MCEDRECWKNLFFSSLFRKLGPAIYGEFAWKSATLVLDIVFGWRCIRTCQSFVTRNMRSVPSCRNTRRCKAVSDHMQSMQPVYLLFFLRSIWFKFRHILMSVIFVDFGLCFAIDRVLEFLIGKSYQKNV